MSVVVLPVLMQPSVANAAAQNLQLGDVVDGKVLKTLVDGRIRILLANTILDLADPGNLIPGTILRLQVAGAPGALRFEVLDQIPPASTGEAASAAAAPAAGASVAADAASAQSALALNGMPQPSQTAATLATAVAAAATRQASLAPLFADTALAATLDQLPALVRDAATQLLALRPPLDENLSAAVVKQAFTSSGLLLEARLALASQALAPPPSTSDDLKAALSAFRALLAGYLETSAATPSGPSAAGAAPAPAMQAADQSPSAPPRSTALSPELSSPQAVERAPSPSLLATRASADAVIAALAAEAAPTAAPAEAALAAPPANAGAGDTPEPLPEPTPETVGRTLAVPQRLAERLVADVEQRLETARLPPGTGPQAASPALLGAPDDFKAAFAVLRSTLARYLESDKGEPAAPDAADAAPASLARPPAAQAAPPPPPYRGAPPTAQAAVAPSIRPDNAPRDVAKILMGEVDGALSRQVLLQVASLPGRTDAHLGDGAAARWTFEVPFALPQGTTVAQLEIARDGHQGARATAADPVWRARFSVDLEPIGPVHALITLNIARSAKSDKGRTTVTLWAERPETSAKLRADVGGLAQALRGAELDPGDVSVRDGAPPLARNGVPAGHFLDRAT